MKILIKEVAKSQWQVRLDQHAVTFRSEAEALAFTRTLEARLCAPHQIPDRSQQRAAFDAGRRAAVFFAAGFRAGALRAAALRAGAASGLASGFAGAARRAAPCTLCTPLAAIWLAMPVAVFRAS